MAMVDESMKESLYKSIALHLVVLVIFLIDMPKFWHDNEPMRQVPIIVDLNKVKISEMTNLPPKAERGKEEKKASTVKRKIEKYTTPEPEQKEQPKKVEPKAPEKAPKPVPVEEKVEKPKSDYLVAEEKKKQAAPKRQEKIVPVPQRKPKVKQPTKPKTQPKKVPELANPLKSLLASVDDLEKTLGEENETAVIKEDAEVNNMGVEGGTGGSYFSELSISELDAIAGRLRACWNLDPGAKGAQNMIIEIKATLKPNGDVAEVDIVDKSRYNSDGFYRSVAESARRAVYICAPYKIFAEKYADHYEMWQTLLLRFNPLDASIN